MASTSPTRMTMEAVRSTPEFHKLTPQQRFAVETFSASGDKILAIRAAYSTKSREVARVMAAELFASPRVRAVLDLLEGKTPFEKFKEAVDRVVKSGSKATDAEIEALALQAKLHGWTRPKNLSIRKRGEHDMSKSPETPFELRSGSRHAFTPEELGILDGKCDEAVQTAFASFNEDIAAMNLDVEQRKEALAVFSNAMSEGLEDLVTTVRQACSRRTDY